MNFASSNTRKAAAIARLALLVSCALALAACETDGAGVPDTATVRTQAAKPPEPLRDAEPMTRSRAARECWMRTERANAREDLDKRADLVDKCIDEKMKAVGMPAPRG